MDYIIQHWPAIILWLGSVATAFLGGIWVNRLTMNREADARRRKFRDEVRAVGFQFDRVQPINFLKTYDQAALAVRGMCLTIYEDIHWWKRGSFSRHRDEYCGFTHEQLQLPTSRCNPVELPIRMKENRKRQDDMIVVLKQKLELIAKDAG